MLSLRPLSELDFDALLALWNAAYGGYLVPLQFDRAMLERHIRRAGLDLARSVAGSVDGEDYGLSLAAFRDRRAWIGGFGIGEAFRRRGLATRLMAAHLEQLDAQGVGEVWLEVIDANPAREVYRRCGFDEVRELRMFEGAVPAAGAPAEISVEDFLARHAALNAQRPTWRREVSTLLDSITVEKAAVLGLEGAYAVALDQDVRVHVVDAAAADVATATALLGAVAARFPGKPIRLVDEPSGSPLARACEAAGVPNVLNQVEMVRH